MLHHNILTSFFLVVCAHSQLTQHPRFQTVSSTDKPRPSLQDRSQANSDELPFNVEQKEGFSSVTSIFIDDYPDVQATGLSAASGGTLLSVGDRFKNLSALLLQSSFTSLADEGDLAATDVKQTPYGGRPGQVVGTPKPTTEQAPHSPLAREPSRQSDTQDHTMAIQTYNYDMNQGQAESALTTLRQIGVTPRPDTHVFDNTRETVTMSSLLRDTFMGQNPNVLRNHFSDKVNPRLSLSSHVSLPANNPPEDGDSPPSSSYSMTSKREAETVWERDGERETDSSPISVEQRSWRCSIPDVLVGDEELPWTCRQRFAWRHLGEHVYPSRLYEAVCEGRTCWYGHFNCTPITYTLHVLQVCLHGCQDQRVPFPLRSRWQWTDLNVTVGCQCVR